MRDKDIIHPVDAVTAGEALAIVLAIIAIALFVAPNESFSKLRLIGTKDVFIGERCLTVK